MKTKTIEEIYDILEHIAKEIALLREERYHDVAYQRKELNVIARGLNTLADNQVNLGKVLTLKVKEAPIIYPVSKVPEIKEICDCEKCKSKKK